MKQHLHSRSDNAERYTIGVEKEIPMRTPLQCITKLRKQNAERYEQSWNSRVSHDPSAQALHNDHRQVLCSEFGTPQPYIETLMKGRFSQPPVTPVHSKEKKKATDYVQLNKTLVGAMGIRRSSLPQPPMCQLHNNIRCTKNVANQTTSFKNASSHHPADAKCL
jgi:hypothetical protein